MSSALLINFDGESPLIAKVNAFPTYVGGVLFQKQHGVEKNPVYFLSKKLSAAEKNS